MTTQTLKNALLGSAATRQAPETATGGDTEVVRKKVAKHELVDADGNPLADDVGEESAMGAKYTLLANGQTFTYLFGKNADADRMLAVFGAKTLATNETSAARNNTKGEATPDEQIAAVRERFDLLASGKWVDRTREGVGAAVNKDALAQAIASVLVSEGKKTQEEVDTGYLATVRQKLEDDPGYARKARTYGPVSAAYAAIVGKTTATVDDLLA